MDKEKLKAISIMGLGGGMGIGFEQAGYDVVATVEGNDKAGAAVRKNWANRTHLIGEPEDWPTMIDGLNLHDKLHLAYGSPPCQGVSGANARSSAENPKNEFFVHFIKAAVTTGAKHIVFENIPRMLSLGREYVQLARDEAEANGYTFSIHRHNAADFGVSQNRQRVMFVCSRKGSELSWPSMPRPETFWSVREAFSDLADIEPVDDEGLRDNPRALVEYDRPAETEYQELLRSAEGGTANHREIGMKERWTHIEPGTQWTSSVNKHLWTEEDVARMEDGRIFNAAEAYRMRETEVGRTVTGVPNKVHPWKPRHLTLRECSRLMGFPDSWEWPDNRNLQALAAGVCPAVCKWYGEVLIADESGAQPPVPEGFLF